MSKNLLCQIEGGSFAFWCPACQCGHFVTKSWEIKNENEKPTVSPSVLVRWWKTPPEPWEKNDKGEWVLENGRIKGSKLIICHSFIRNGVIEYLTDCTHEMGGQRIPMVSYLDHGE